VVPVSLSESEVTRYYHGFSNGTLWPLFHSLPARAHFDRRDWLSYEKVNAADRDFRLRSGQHPIRFRSNRRKLT
jgi:trehalose-6-phosphate synthase